MFHLAPTYRDFVKEQWTSLDKKLQKVIEKELEMRNYKKEMYLDEFQAYLLDDPADFGRKWRVNGMS
jgi:hypothetical protein